MAQQAESAEALAEARETFEDLFEAKNWLPERDNAQVAIADPLDLSGDDAANERARLTFLLARFFDPNIRAQPTGEDGRLLKDALIVPTEYEGETAYCFVLRGHGVLIFRDGRYNSGNGQYFTVHQETVASCVGTNSGQPDPLTTLVTGLVPPCLTAGCSLVVLSRLLDEEALPERAMAVIRSGKLQNIGESRYLTTASRLFDATLELAAGDSAGGSTPAPPPSAAPVAAAATPAPATPATGGSSKGGTPGGAGGTVAMTPGPSAPATPASAAPDGAAPQLFVDITLDEARDAAMQLSIEEFLGACKAAAEESGGDVEETLAAVQEAFDTFASGFCQADEELQAALKAAEPGASVSDEPAPDPDSPNPQQAAWLENLRTMGNTTQDFIMKTQASIPDAEEARRNFLSFTRRYLLVLAIHICERLLGEPAPTQVNWQPPALRQATWERLFSTMRIVSFEGEAVFEAAANYKPSVPPLMQRRFQLAFAVQHMLVMKARAIQASLQASPVEQALGHALLFQGLSRHVRPAFAALNRLDGKTGTVLTPAHNRQLRSIKTATAEYIHESMQVALDAGTEASPSTPPANASHQREALGADPAIVAEQHRVLALIEQALTDAAKYLDLQYFGLPEGRPAPNPDPFRRERVKYLRDDGLLSVYKALTTPAWLGVKLPTLTQVSSDTINSTLRAIAASRTENAYPTDLQADLAAIKLTNEILKGKFPSSKTYGLIAKILEEVSKLIACLCDPVSALADLQSSIDKLTQKPPGVQTGYDGWLDALTHEHQKEVKSLTGQIEQFVKFVNQFIDVILAITAERAKKEKAEANLMRLSTATGAVQQLIVSETFNDIQSTMPAALATLRSVITETREALAEHCPIATQNAEALYRTAESVEKLVAHVLATQQTSSADTSGALGHIVRIQETLTKLKTPANPTGPAKPGTSRPADLYGPDGQLAPIIVVALTLVENNLPLFVDCLEAKMAALGTTLAQLEADGGNTTPPGDKATIETQQAALAEKVLALEAAQQDVQGARAALQEVAEQHDMLAKSRTLETKAGERLSALTQQLTALGAQLAEAEAASEPASALSTLALPPVNDDDGPAATSSPPPPGTPVSGGGGAAAAEGPANWATFGSGDAGGGVGGSSGTPLSPEALGELVFGGAQGGSGTEGAAGAGATTGDGGAGANQSAADVIDDVFGAGGATTTGTAPAPPPAAPAPDNAGDDDLWGTDDNAGGGPPPPPAAPPAEPPKDDGPGGSSSGGGSEAGGQKKKRKKRSQKKKKDEEEDLPIYGPVPYSEKDDPTLYESAAAAMAEMSAGMASAADAVRSMLPDSDQDEPIAAFPTPASGENKTPRKKKKSRQTTIAAADDEDPDAKKSAKGKPDSPGGSSSNGSNGNNGDDSGGGSNGGDATMEALS